MPTWMFISFCSLYKFYDNSAEKGLDNSSVSKSVSSESLWKPVGSDKKPVLFRGKRTHTVHFTTSVGAWEDDWTPVDLKKEDFVDNSDG